MRRTLSPNNAAGKKNRWIIVRRRERERRGTIQSTGTIALKRHYYRNDDTLPTPRGRGGVTSFSLSSRSTLTLPRTEPLSLDLVECQHGRYEPPSSPPPHPLPSSVFFVFVIGLHRQMNMPEQIRETVD